MNPKPPLDPIAARLLRTMRDAQFPSGLVCVRCGAPNVIRWGRAHGRQRYRCRACRRTFSDLTATPLRYTKRLSSWPAYLQCMERSDTVRRAAAIVGVHPATAFRWRHVVLAAARANEHARLTGLVELTWLSMRHSEKGVRGARRARRMRLYVTVLYARDRTGRSFAGRGPRFALRSYDVIFGDVIADDAHILADARPNDGAAIFARMRCAGLTRCMRFASDDTDGRLEHLHNVLGEIRRLEAWLPRFHGVATHYLLQYLRWHRMLDGKAEGLLVTNWARATSAPPTLPANMTDETPTDGPPATDT